MTMKCDGCNEPIDNRPADAYGGDWYSSCNICEWHSEGEGSSTIKQGLTLEELVAHKKRLNKLYQMMHTKVIMASGIGTGIWTWMDELQMIMGELIDTEE